MWNAFWRWYERNYALNLTVALGLFILQILHLVWLTGDVVWERLFAVPLFGLTGAHELFMVAVDYTEIPALISVSLIYINELRKGFSAAALVYLFFLNLQWLHLFWITDEFVVGALSAPGATVLPVWLAWIAIVIDYLEIPVMYDTSRRFLRALKR